MEYKLKPWKHQLEAIERARLLDNYALFFEMGAGKTSTTINILRHKMNDRREFLRTLILCPPIVVKNWKDEWLTHSKIDSKDIVLLIGTGKKRKKLFEEHAFETVSFAGDTIKRPQGKIFVTNYETLLMSDLYELFQKWQPQALVFDESHYLKSYKANRTKLAEELANPYDRVAKRKLPRPYVYILSGTPVLNSPLDLFSQFLILDGGHTFGSNFFAFRARYFRDKNAGMPKDRYFPNWEIIPGALDEINKKIFTVGMRVEKKDCIDLPPLVKQTIKVSMSPDQARLYKEMKQHFITFMEDKACVATLAITKALRLQQITSGFISLAGEGAEDDPVQKRLEKTPKLEALKSLLEELTPYHKVLVWAVWKENYEQIKEVCKELGVEFVEVHGGIPTAKKFENVNTFNTDPKCRVFIGHPGSGGIGINLVVASYSIFYSRTFSLEQSLQAEARNHRGGSKEAGHEKITRIDLVCEGTIDELVTEKLANKIEVSDKVLRDLSLEMKNQEI